MPNFHHHSELRTDAPSPQLDRALRNAVLAGLALVLLVPLARADSTWLGWAPLWLVGMPAAAWWALHRFRLPRWPTPAVTALRSSRRRRSGTQARRRARPVGLGTARAA